MDAVIRKKFFDTLESEIRHLIDPATGMVRADVTRVVDCPVCEAPPASNEVLFHKHGFTFVRCGACDLIFTNPQVRTDVIEEIYRESESASIWATLMTSEKEMGWKVKYYQDNVALIEQHAGTRSPRVLDIGCSTGQFLEIARGMKPEFDLAGIDLNEDACEKARAKGLNVRQKRVEELDESESYDVFTLFGVMEHLPNPRKMIRDIKKKARPGGGSLIFAIVPNAYSLYHMFLQDKSLSFDGRDHLIYFSETTLRTLFEKEGMKVVHLDTTLNGFGSIKRQIQWLDPNGDNDTEKYLSPSMRELLGSGAADDFLQRYNLGLRLRVIAST